MHEEIRNLGTRHPCLVPVLDDVQRMFLVLAGGFSSGGKLLLCGNGGSAADCDHIVGELMKPFRLPRPLTPEFRDRLEWQGAEGKALASALRGGLPAVSLTGHPALSLAVANDMHADLVFAQQVVALGRPGDILFGISTSGGSANVIHAFRAAKARGMRTVALTGAGGGRLVELADAAVRVPATVTPEIQELHLPVYHSLCVALEACFFGGSAGAVTG